MLTAVRRRAARRALARRDGGGKGVASPSNGDRRVAFAICDPRSPFGLRSLPIERDHRNEASKRRSDEATHRRSGAAAQRQSATPRANMHQYAHQINPRADAK
ncbi:hypothetical protein WS71_05130 [Burkholderia mayonis]|uniref:Uncharacterized protein n=1 Tax=Burkholderia mayonis TaxID=1385591 RepID=A0A1B4FSV2_9BURK|nr:hypothetical protein WS71_05130 [Burkholderia mayonis]